MNGEAATPVLHAMVEEQAKASPDAVALVCGQRLLTYAELEGWASGVAASLTAGGVVAGTPVGLMAEPSLELVVGMLAILKAGGHYVALGPNIPHRRLASMCSGVGLTMVVGTARALTDWERVQGVGLIDLAAAPTCAGAPETDMTHALAPDTPAYILHTSGSTGVPKGVVVEHRNVTALLRAFEAVAPSRSPLVGTNLCPFTFDVSVWEIFSVLCFGGTLHVLTPPITGDPDALVEYVLGNGVTSTYLPPGLVEGVARRLRRANRPVTLDRILVGVEPIIQSVLQELRDLSDSVRIVNGYGPTETTVCATFFPFTSASNPLRRTPIGFPALGYKVHVVDDDLLPVTPGSVGEILVGGAGVARGYVNDPVATASKFLVDPFSDPPGAGRVYRTGDLGRVLPDGALEYVGRADSQVKVRGFRVELGDVEQALSRCRGARRVVVLAPDSPAGRRLIAFVEGDPAVPGDEIRRQLAGELPEYMIPSRVVSLERFPQNDNGKIDRESLLEIDRADPELHGGSTVMPTSLEGRVVDVWREVLGIDHIGLADNFFDLGGDSLSAITIANRLSDDLACSVSVRDLFLLPTVAELAGRARVLMREDSAV